VNAHYDLKWFSPPNIIKTLVPAVTAALKNTAPAFSARQSMSIRTGKIIIKNRKSAKTSAKIGVKNQMVRMSWMKTIFRSRSIVPNVIGKKIVCCS
jgi:hypothetical protein